MAKFLAFIQKITGVGLVSALTLVNSASFAQTAPTILVLGDSLAAEYGIRRDSGWVALLNQRLKKQGFRYQVKNASISGETTSGGLTRLPALLQQHQPEILIIELGANDGLRGFPLESTRQNLSKMIVAGKKAKAKILLLGMQLPPNYGAQYTRQFSALFSDLAQQHKTALSPFFLAKIANDASFFQNDQLHPNEKAQALLLENVWVSLRPLLKN